MKSVAYKGQGVILSTLSWEEFSVYLCIDRKLSDSKKNLLSIKSRYTILQNWLGENPLNRESFTSFLSYLKDKSSDPSYMNNYIKLIKHVDAYYLLKGIPLNLKDFGYFRETRKIIDILNTDEILLLITLDYPYVRLREEKNLIYQALFTLMAQTGCRVGEAVNLLQRDVLDGITHVIFRDTKNGEDRAVPISSELYTRIKSIGGEWAFPSFYGGHLTESVLNDDLKKRAKFLGIQKPVHNHLLRHSFITLALEAGISVDDVAVIVGHKSISTTMIYKHSALTHYSSVILTHPLLKQTVSLATIKDRALDLVEKLVDKSKFIVSIEQSDKSFSIKINVH